MKHLPMVTIDVPLPDLNLEAGEVGIIVAINEEDENLAVQVLCQEDGKVLEKVVELTKGQVTYIGSVSYN